MTAVGAVVPDVAILHVQRADAFGNTYLWGNLGVAVEAAYAANRVILTCEEIASREVIASGPNRTLIPGMLVDAVVQVPCGAHPSPAQGFWKRDDEYFLQYHERSRKREHFLEWLKEWVSKVPDRDTYREKLGTQHVRKLPNTDKRLPIGPIVTMGDPPNVASAIACTGLLDVRVLPAESNPPTPAWADCSRLHRWYGD
jgi:glutaconate CoA-transferase, subunit A